MILLIDNYDSFIHNLGRYLRRLGQEIVVLRNDSPDLRSTIRNNCQAIVLSPGPCSPDEAGECLSIVQEFSGQIPILGVCLGHQVICQAFGGRIIKALRPMHGVVSDIELCDSPLFAQIESPQPFARYHSLVCEEDSLGSCLRVTARSRDTSEVMAVQHIQHTTFGVQFHPESVLSAAGYAILTNFLRASAISVVGQTPQPDYSAANAEQMHEMSRYYALSTEHAATPQEASLLNSNAFYQLKVNGRDS